MGKLSGKPNDFSLSKELHEQGDKIGRFLHLGQLFKVFSNN